MHWRLADLWQRVRAALPGTARDAEMDEELRFHLDMATARNVGRGMPPDEARRAALVTFGGVQRTREAAWDVQRARWLEDAWHDARHAARMLRRMPGFTLAAVLTLALGIGANTAILSVLDAVLLRPLPYHEPSSLVAFTPERYDAYRRWTGDARSLESVGAYTYTIANVIGGTEPARVWALAVSASLLPTIGVAPAMGRGFTAEDDVPEAPPRVMLRHEFWRTHFGADRSLVGRTIDLSGLAYEVIGILPPELEFPPPARRADGSMPRVADIWLGIGRLPDLHERGGFLAVGRLAAGVRADHAAAELTSIANAERASASDSVRIALQRVEEAVEAPLRPAILVFVVGVGLVLLIACANLGGLLLARLASRQRELAVRTSLGASRGRIGRQILTESGILALAGAGAGIGLGWLLLRALMDLAPPELARVPDATLNGRVLAATLVLTVLTTLLIGVLPALRAVRRDHRATLGAARGTTVDRATGRAQAALVACEVAFAVVLLVGGGLLGRSFMALASIDPGFRAEALVTAEVLIPPDRYPTRESVIQFFERLEERLAGLPGVRSASAIDRLPYGSSVSGMSFAIVGRDMPTTDLPRGLNTAARPGYFETMGIPIVAGREFSSAEGTDAAPVIIIGKALADRWWPGSTPIGSRIRVFGIEREIVGVAGDVRHLGPTTPVDPMIYLPQAQDITTRRMMTVVVRADMSASALLPAVRGEIRALDPLLPVSNLRTFGSLKSERTAAGRFNALLIGSFAALAVLLAAVGIYGVMSFIVTQRTREIGVRMALGASRASVQHMFLRQALRAAAVGSIIGVLVAIPLARLARGLLFGIEPVDPLTYVGVLGLVAVIAVLAAWAPAARASRVSPSLAMVAD